MKRLSAFWTVILSFLLLSLIGLLIAPFVPLVMEKFGAQGGEMVQLASSHVPTMEDVREEEEEQKQVASDILNMTGAPL